MSSGNNNNQIKRVIIPTLIAALIASIGWIFIQVRDLPANYVPRSEVEKRLERIENKIDLTYKILLRENRGD